MLFAFISRIESHPWGGSEELWSQAARRLISMGHHVVASVTGWEGIKPPRLKELEELGAVISYRFPTRPLLWWQRGLLRIPADPFHMRKSDWIEELACRKPDFLLISEGGNRVPRDLCRVFVTKGIPFAIVHQSAAEAWWPTDYEVNKAAYVYEHAKAIYFVSEGNRRLTRTQYVGECQHTEVIRNPFNVDYDATLPWPEPSGSWKLAFVGRLEPEAKGCDILLDVLNARKWRSRNLVVSFFGEGRGAGSVRKYSEMLKLDNVRFRGHVSNIEEVWKEHHLLVLPSRHEGLPLAVVEAMLCRRPCVVTDVGGNAELIEDNVTGFISEACTVKHFDEAMERAWSVRGQWREIGEKAGVTIRAFVPRDPAGVFAGKLIELASPGARSS